MTDAEVVQQELQDYLQKKGINTLFMNLVESLLLAKPENPIRHIVQYLCTTYPDETQSRSKLGRMEDDPTLSCQLHCTYGMWSTQRFLRATIEIEIEIEIE